MWKKALTIGFANLILGFLINWMVTLIAPQLAAEYQNTAIFRPWTDPLMTIYFAYPFILAFVLVRLWNLVGGKFSKNKALEFAKLYFFIATVPGMFITYTSFQLSIYIVGLWTLTGFLQAYVAGYIFARSK